MIGDTKLHGESRPLHCNLTVGMNIIILAPSPQRVPDPPTRSLGYPVALPYELIFGKLHVRQLLGFVRSSPMCSLVRRVPYT